MACKHEGGTDPCRRGKYRGCAVRERQYTREFVTRANLPATRSDAGQAGELFVAADLLSRQLPVTKPLNTNGPHDLHAKINGTWTTIQVKSAARNRKTGALKNTCPWSRISSDILALAYLPTRQIRYIRTKERTDCPFLSFTADAVTQPSSAGSATAKSSRACSATATNLAAKNSTSKSHARRPSKSGSTERETDDNSKNHDKTPHGNLPYAPKSEVDQGVEK